MSFFYRIYKTYMAAFVLLGVANSAGAAQIHADYQMAAPAFVKREASNFRNTSENYPLGNLSSLQPYVTTPDAKGTTLLFQAALPGGSIDPFVAHGKVLIKTALEAYINGLLARNKPFLEAAVASAGGLNGTIGNTHGGVAGVVNDPRGRKRKAFTNALLALIDAPDSAELEALDPTRGRVTVPVNLRLKTLKNVEAGVKDSIVHVINTYIDSLLGGGGADFIVGAVHNGGGGHVAAVPVGDGDENMNYPADRTRDAFKAALEAVVRRVSF